MVRVLRKTKTSPARQKVRKTHKFRWENPYDLNKKSTLQKNMTSIQITNGLEKLSHLNIPSIKTGNSNPLE